MLPSDGTRVKLQDPDPLVSDDQSSLFVNVVILSMCVCVCCEKVEGSDYINANYLDSQYSRRAYIATQVLLHLCIWCVFEQLLTATILFFCFDALSFHVTG